MKLLITKVIIIMLASIITASPVLASDQIGDQVSKLIGLWNGGDVTMLDDLVADDYVGHLPPSVGPDALMGKEGFSFNLGGWRAGLPDMQLVVVDTIVGEHKAVVRTSLSATHTETFFGIPPTQQALGFDMVFSYHFNEDGLVTEEWIDWDTTLELIQLGLFTPPGSN